MKNKKKLIVSISIVIAVVTIVVVSALFINGHNIKVREETLYSSKIDEKIDGLLIAYFSDLHYGNNLTEKDIDDIQDRINSFNPDIIIFGGDLISKKCNETDKLDLFLTSLNAKLGKYAVLGDEDVYNNQAKETLERAHFKILSNSSERIYHNNSFVNLIGINPSVNGNPDVLKAYEGVDGNYYTVAITHCPDLASSLDNKRTDYILAGHSLGGPVYIPIINLLYRENGAINYFKGKNYVNSIVLDITNGLGTKNKDIRLFADAEIVFYKLKTN